MDAIDKLSNYIEELEQGGKQARARVVEFVDEVKKLEEENKKLDESYQAARDRVIELLGEKKEYLDHIKELQEENDRLKNNAMEDMRVQTKLEEENKKLNIKVASLEGEIKGLNYTIEELHKELSECECSFCFENDEVGFWKGEYKRLKKWIKDHCNGYGNLFPEDEMKRQWKKADKKRK